MAVDRGVVVEWGPVLGVGGLVAAVGTAIVAWRKSGPESAETLVGAATNVVLIQKGELDRLNDNLKQIRQQLADANARAWKAEQQAAELIIRVRHLEELQQAAHDKRIADIEDRVTAEEARNTDIEGFARETRGRADDAERRADAAEERADASEERADEHGEARPEEHEEHDERSQG